MQADFLLLLSKPMLSQLTLSEIAFFKEQKELRENQIAAIHEQKVDVESVMTCVHCKKKTIRFVAKGRNSKDEPDNIYLVCESCDKKAKI